jgi:hypothetical protein
MTSHEREDRHNVGGGLMQIAFLAVLAYVLVTVTCFGALMSMAGRTRRRADDTASTPPPRKRLRV